MFPGGRCIPAAGLGMLCYHLLNHLSRICIDIIFQIFNAFQSAWKAWWSRGSTASKHAYELSSTGSTKAVVLEYGTARTGGRLACRQVYCHATGFHNAARGIFLELSTVRSVHEALREPSGFSGQKGIFPRGICLYVSTLLYYSTQGHLDTTKLYRAGFGMPSLWTALTVQQCGFSFHKEGLAGALTCIVKVSCIAGSNACDHHGFSLFLGVVHNFRHCAPSLQVQYLWISAPCNQATEYTSTCCKSNETCIGLCTGRKSVPPPERACHRAPTLFSHLP